MQRFQLLIDNLRICKVNAKSTFFRNKMKCWKLHWATEVDVMPWLQLNNAVRHTMDSFKKDWNWFSRTKDIVFCIPHILYPCQNLACILLIMQFDSQQLVQSGNYHNLRPMLKYLRVLYHLWSLDAGSKKSMAPIDSYSKSTGSLEKY